MQEGPARMATPLASSALLLHGDLLVFHSCVLVFIGGQFRDLPGRSMEETHGGPFGALAKEPEKAAPCQSPRNKLQARGPPPPRHGHTLYASLQRRGLCPAHALSIRCPFPFHPAPFPVRPGLQRLEKKWGIVAILRLVPCPSAVHPVSIRCPSPVHPALFLSILPFGGWKSVGNPVHPAPPSGLCIILREERAQPRQPGARRAVHTGARRVALLEFYRRGKSKENLPPV